MAAGLHGSARTTPRVRAELQRSQDATRRLAAHYRLNPKTVAKWRKRTSTADAPMGPSRPHSSVLTETEEAIVVEFRRRTLLPLDDVLGCLRETIPRLSRSALHRCLVRHGISRLPEGEEKASKRKRFAETRIGYVHIDVRELRLAQGKLFMFLAIDRVSKFAHVAFLDANTKANGAAFRREVVEIFPYQLHTVLTDNGMAFADLPKNRGRHPELEAMFGGHIFDRICNEHGIRHRLASLSNDGPPVLVKCWPTPPGVTKSVSDLRCWCEGWFGQESKGGIVRAVAPGITVRHRHGEVRIPTIAAGDSERKRPPVPIEGGQGFRRPLPGGFVVG